MKNTKHSIIFICLMFLGLSGWSQTTCPGVSAPALSVSQTPVCTGKSTVLVAKVTGIRALVLYSWLEDTTITMNYLKTDPRFTVVDFFNAFYALPAFSQLMQYDVVLTWSETPYLDHDSIGDMLKNYVDAGGGVVVFMGSHDPFFGFGIGGTFAADHYDPMDINTPNDYGRDTTNVGIVRDSTFQIMNGVTDVLPDYNYYSTTLSAGASPVFYWISGYIGCAVKTIGNGSTVGINFEPLWTHGASAGLLCANAAVWAAGKVNWYASCGGSLVGSGKTLKVTPAAATTYYATFTNICGSVSACSNVSVDITTQNCFDINSLCAYTILAEDEADLTGCNVYNGGVGVINSWYGDIDLRYHSNITGANAFAKAKNIYVDQTSNVSVRNLTPANISIPAFESNPYWGFTYVYVPQNTTMTLNGTNYWQVVIGTNATAIFTKPNVYIGGLSMYDNSNLRFTQPAKVHLQSGIDCGRNIKINHDGLNVTFYISDDMNFGAGDQATGVFYLGYNNCWGSGLGYSLYFPDSRCTAAGSYTGMFLAESITVKNNNNFYGNPYNSFCSQIATKDLVVDEDVPQTESGTILENYPNPFSEQTSIQFMLPEDNNVIIDVYDVTGKLIRTIYNGQVNKNQRYNVEFDGKALPSGLYIYRMSTDNEVYNGRMILNKN